MGWHLMYTTYLTVLTFLTTWVLLGIHGGTHGGRYLGIFCSFSFERDGKGIFRSRVGWFTRLGLISWKSIWTIYQFLFF